jgi:hypothetical protein
MTRELKNIQGIAKSNFMRTKKHLAELEGKNADEVEIEEARAAMIKAFNKLQEAHNNYLTVVGIDLDADPDGQDDMYMNAPAQVSDNLSMYQWTPHLIISTGDNRNIC